jgi:hypothetical protein
VETATVPAAQSRAVPDFAGQPIGDPWGNTYISADWWAFWLAQEASAETTRTR